MAESLPGLEDLLRRPETARERAVHQRPARVVGVLAAGVERAGGRPGRGGRRRAGVGGRRPWIVVPGREHGVVGHEREVGPQALRATRARSPGPPSTRSRARAGAEPANACDATGWTPSRSRSPSSSSTARAPRGRRSGRSPRRAARRASPRCRTRRRRRRSGAAAGRGGSNAIRSTTLAGSASTTRSAVDLRAGGRDDGPVVAPGDALDRARQMHGGPEPRGERQRDALVAAGDARADVVRVGGEPGERRRLDPVGARRARDLEPGLNRLAGARVERQPVEQCGGGGPGFERRAGRRRSPRARPAARPPRRRSRRAARDRRRACPCPTGRDRSDRRRRGSCRCRAG